MTNYMDTMDTSLSIENYKPMRGPSEMYVYTHTHARAGSARGSSAPLPHYPAGRLGGRCFDTMDRWCKL